MEPGCGSAGNSYAAPPGWSGPPPHSTPASYMRWQDQSAIWKNGRHSPFGPTPPPPDASSPGRPERPPHTLQEPAAPVPDCPAVSLHTLPGPFCIDAPFPGIHRKIPDNAFPGLTSNDPNRFPPNNIPKKGRRFVL